MIRKYGEVGEKVHRSKNQSNNRFELTQDRKSVLHQQSKVLLIHNNAVVPWYPTRLLQPKSKMSVLDICGNPLGIKTKFDNYVGGYLLYS